MNQGLSAARAGNAKANNMAATAATTTTARKLQTLGSCKMQDCMEEEIKHLKKSLFEAAAVRMKIELKAFRFHAVFEWCNLIFFLRFILLI